MLPWKLRKRQILPVSQNLSLVCFSLAKFQLVSCNLSLAIIWQMTYTQKLPKLCSPTLKGRQIKKLKVSIVCYKARGPTVISYWSKNESCVLYRSYPGQLRSFKRPGYLEVRPEKSRFFLATNLGWRSANAIISALPNTMNSTRYPEFE